MATLDTNAMWRASGQYVDHRSPHELTYSAPVFYESAQRDSGKISASLPDIPLEWLQSCLRYHDPCKEANLGSFMPLRLIDTGEDAKKSPQLRLIVTDQHNISDNRYIALSHRWLSTEENRGMELKTNLSTLEERKSGIDIEKLSKTFRFTVDVCRWLGVRYIWIDSFCIIQDSKDDWEAESLNMAEIYRNAYCTIAVNIEESSNAELWKGCGHSATISDTHWVNDYIESGRWRSQPTLWEGLLEGGLLGSRAWCLQERQLSPRMFHFFDCGLMMWECCCIIGALGGPVIFGNPPTSSTDSKPDSAQRMIDTERHRIPGQVSLNNAPFHMRDVLNSWYALVTDYSSRSLTYESDRPVALRGIVSQLQRLTGYNFHSGLWHEDIIRGLLCERQNSPHWSWSRVSSSESRRTPSWSWYSVLGPVKGVAANDEDKNPIIFEDRRRNRPIFDHSYSSHLEDFNFESEARLRLKGFIMSRRWTSYNCAHASTSGLVPFFKDSSIPPHRGPDSKASVCMDIPGEQPTENENLTVIALTKSYGLLLQEMERKAEFRRLGVVRLPRSWLLGNWPSHHFEVKSITLV